MISASGVEGSLLRHEPSTIWVFGVEGSHLETEPSMKRGIAWKVRLYSIEPSMIWVFGVEGSHLESEPSMKMGISVEGSVLDIGRLASIAAMLYRIVGMFAE